MRRVVEVVGHVVGSRVRFKAFRRPQRRRAPVVCDRDGAVSMSIRLDELQRLTRFVDRLPPFDFFRLMLPPITHHPLLHRASSLATVRLPQRQTIVQTTKPPSFHPSHSLYKHHINALTPPASLPPSPPPPPPSAAGAPWGRWAGAFKRMGSIGTKPTRVLP